MGWGTSTATTPDDQVTDYAEQNLSGIAKVMAVNPELGASMMQAYQTRTTPTDGFLSGLWNAVTSPVKGILGALGNITSGFAEPFRNEEEDEGDNFIVDMWQGFTGQENTTWRDNLLSYGMEEGFGTTALGLAGDIFLDPTTYLGAGLLGKAGGNVAKFSQDLTTTAAKKTVLGEVAAKGGIEVGGTLIRKSDDFVSTVQAMSHDALRKAGVSDEVIEGLSGITAANAERSVIASVDDLARRSYESIGRIVGDVVIQRKSIHALPSKVVDDTGRVWSKSELVKIFNDTSKLSYDDLMKLGNEMYGAKAVARTSAEFGRNAAAALGGVRLKFGLPFAQTLARTMDSPFLAYRWTSSALPWANRLRFGSGGLRVGNQVIAEGVAFSKMGDFFRGVSGINRLDNAIQRSLIEGGVWQREHMSAFLRDGFSGLRTRMLNGTPEEARAFTELFGNKSVSSFMMTSERMGDFTAGITPAAQMWRRGGVVGLRAADSLRNAKAGKRVFRAFAAQHEETWSKAALQLETDASKGLIDKDTVYNHFIQYLEGLTDDLTPLPDYMRKPAEEMRELYPQILERARGMGANVGDVTEVYARRRAETAVKMLDEEYQKVQKQLLEMNEADAKAGVKAADQTTGVGPAREATKQKLAAKIMDLEFQGKRIKSQLEKQKSVIEDLDNYDTIIAKLRGTSRVAEKASPSRYFHRRFTAEARQALIGNARSGTKAYNKAKRMPAELERQLAGLSFREAEEVVRRNYKALGGVKKIWEDNPFLVYGHYVEEMAEAVYKAQIGEQAAHLMSHLGAVDNGLIVDIGAKVRANMPNTIADLARKAEGIKAKGRDQVAKWLDDMSVATGAKIDDGRQIPEPIAKDLGLDYVGDVPGPWREAALADKAEIMPISTVKQLREFHREGFDALDEGYVKSSAKKIEEAIESIKANGFTEPLIMEVHHSTGRAVLIEGNHRLVAAERLGMKGVPVRVVMNYSEQPYEVLGIFPGKLADKKGVASKAKEIKIEDGYKPTHFKPSQVFPDKYLRGQIPKLNEDQMRQLQDTMKELNSLKTKISGLEAKPEVAIQEAVQGLNKSYWGKVDVPGMENVVMHPYIAAEFNKAWHGPATKGPGTVGALQDSYRSWVMGPWKKWATIYWPGFHARNAMGAWFNNWLGGVTNYHYRQAGHLEDVFRKGKKSKWHGKQIPGIKELDGIKGPVTYGALANLMRDTGVYSVNSLALADLRLLTSGAEEVNFNIKGHRISSKTKLPFTKRKESRWGPVTGTERFMRTWEAAGVNSTSFIENYFRGAAFLKGLEETAGDVAGARSFTMMRHGDYDELTDAEYFIRDLVPFYKWIRTNFPFQVRRLIENPGKSLATLDVANAAVDPELRNKLPDWMKESFLVQLPSAIAGSKDAPGILSLQLPLSDVFLSSNEFASSFLPIVKNVILENQLFKKNLYTGAPIEGTKFEKVSGWVDSVGLGHVLDAFGVGTRDAQGNLVMSDKMVNTLQAFPIFGRARGWLLDEASDEETKKNRITAFMSSMAGAPVREAGEKLLNGAEADYFFTHIKPQLDGLRNKGYKLPTIDDLWGAANEGGW